MKPHNIYWGYGKYRDFYHGVLFMLSHRRKTWLRIDSLLHGEKNELIYRRLGNPVILSDGYLDIQSVPYFFKKKDQIIFQWRIKRHSPWSWFWSLDIKTRSIRQTGWYFCRQKRYSAIAWDCHQDITPCISEKKKEKELIILLFFFFFTYSGCRLGNDFRLDQDLIDWLRSWNWYLNIPPRSCVKK